MMLYFITVVFAVLGSGDAIHEDWSPLCLSPNVDCLEVAKMLATNHSIFWFGDSYESRCPPEKLSTIDCYNPRGLSGDSLLTATLGSDGRADDIRGLLKVVYPSRPGYAYGCGHAQYSTGEDLTIDPFKPPEESFCRPFDMRHLPEFSWPYEPGKLYLLLIISDDGSHGIYMNIPGNDISQATVLEEYYGVDNYRDRPKPYAFYVFEQRIGYIEEMLDLKAMFGEYFDTPKFHELFIGPIAINWVSALFDAYSVGKKSALTGFDNCASLISNNFKKLLGVPLSLTRVLKIEITSEAFEYSHCGESRYIDAAKFGLDPIEIQTLPNSAYLRDEGATMRLSSYKSPGPYADLNTCQIASTNPPEETLYTLMIRTINPGESSVLRPGGPSLGLNKQAFIVMLVANLEGLSNELTTNPQADYQPLPWLNPGTKADDSTSVLFILFKQQERIDVMDLEPFVADCLNGYEGRCFFDGQAWKKYYNLEELGMNWMTIPYDSYAKETSSESSCRN